MEENDYQLSSLPAEEIKKIEYAGVKKEELRDRMDEDFAFFTLEAEKYLIDDKVGVFEKGIINTAATDGNRMIELLSYAEEYLKIAVTDEKSAKRKDLYFTEHAAIGLLTLADMVNEDLAESTTIMGAASAFAVLRGWTAYREIIVEEDDGDITPDLVAWDARNTYWISGKRRNIWVCYVRYALEDEIEDEYKGWNNKKQTKGTIESGGTEYTPIYDIWKCIDPDKPAQNGVAVNGEWIKEPEDVKVGGKPIFYLPIRIKPMRTMPLMMNGQSSESTIKHVGESYLLNNRLVLPVENQLYQYKITRAADLAISANVVEYDSTKSEGEVPKDFVKATAKGGTVYLDIGKGQRLAERMVPPLGTDIDSALGQVMSMRSSGSGLGPVAYGQPPYPATAQGTDIINHNILDAIKPYKLGLERDRVWQAEEFIRQYKFGNFKEREFEGYDSKRKKFKTKINPKKIDDNWRFECKLVLDLVRDENLQVGMAATEIKSGLLSKQTVRDKRNLCKDPDGEQTIIDREMAAGLMPELALLDMAEAVLNDDKDKLKNVLIRQKIVKMLQESMGGPQQGMEGQGIEGQPGIIPPQATAGATRNTSRMPQPVIPNPIKEAARKRGGI